MMRIWMKLSALVLVVLLLVVVDVPVRATPLYTAKLIKQIELNEELFVQGLEVSPAGDLIVGLGLYDDSRVLRIDPTTGQTQELAMGSDADNYYFGEGISFGPGGDLYQLTWKEGQLFVRDTGNDQDPLRFPITRTLHYEGEGWGLAYNKEEEVFYLSNGSNKISIRDAITFSEVSSFFLPETRINELEYVEGFLYANVWTEDYILKIDIEKEEIIGIYDFAEIVSQERKGAEDVLNGIAHIDEDLFYIAGKNWEHLYVFRLR